MEGVRATFCKRERLVSQRLIDMLFGQSASRSLAAFPLRIVYLLRERQSGDEPVQMLVSVPKKRFHHAVDRNHVKRQIREFYRTSSAPLKEAVALKGQGMALAFLFNDTRLWDSSKLSERLQSAIGKLIAAVSEQ